MAKTKCNKVKNNKTLKIKKGKKQTFSQKIIKEWKKQTNGCVKMDDASIYKYDYYLLFCNFDDLNNHIHLVLQNKNNNSIVYLMKKYDTKKSKIIHSKPKRVSILSNPVKIVQEMIQEYNKFIHS